MTTSNGNGAGGERPSGERRSRGLPLQAASRVTGLVTSVMDLHVRIALQEADREKRRLISGAVLLMGGLATLLLALIAAELALVLWLHLGLGWRHGGTFLPGRSVRRHDGPSGAVAAGWNCAGRLQT